MDKRKNTITADDAIEYRLSNRQSRIELQHFERLHELHAGDNEAARADAHRLWKHVQRTWINRAGYSEVQSWWIDSLARAKTNGKAAAAIYAAAELILLAQARANGYERDNSLKMSRPVRLNQMYSVISHSHSYQRSLGTPQPQPIGLSEIGRGMGLESRSPHFYEMLERILERRNVYAVEVPANTPAGYKRVFGLSGYPLDTYGIDTTESGFVYKFEGDAAARVVYRSRKSW